MSAVSMRIWRAPLVFALLTTVGLVSALLGDGVWDTLSALTLGVPVAACGWYGLRRKAVSWTKSNRANSCPPSTQPWKRP
jgi:O-antigen/teichoic acid export membrane protein